MYNEPNASYQENEHIFRILIEESPTPVGLYVGREMVVKLANKAILTVWGKDESVIGRTFSQALPELEGQPFFQLLDEVYTTGIAYEATEDRVDLLVDGKMQTFYFNFTYKPLKDNAGNVWGIINTAADVTELVTTRQKLAESEERTQFMLDSAGLGTWDIDRPKGKIIWNERCRELYGFPPGTEVTIFNVRDNVHPDDAARITESVRIAVDPRTGGDYDDIFRVINSENKTTRWVKCKGKAYFNDEGVCFRFAGTTLDITRDIQIREDQQKLLALVDNAEDVIGVAENDGKVVYLNTAGHKMLGIDNHADIYKQGMEYFTTEDGIKLYQQGTPVVMEQGSWRGELNYRHFKTGEAIPVSLNIIRIDDPATGKGMGRGFIARDLRREKAARTEQFKLQSLINNSSDIISLSDNDGNVTYLNEAGQKILGLKPSEIFRHNSEYLIPTELDRLKKQVDKSLDEKYNWAGPVNYRSFITGEPIPVFCTTMQIFDIGTNNPQGRATVARDLRPGIEARDEQARLNLQLEVNNQKLNDQVKQYEFVTGFMPVQLWTAKTDGLLDYVNDRTLEYFGTSAENIVGPAWQSFIHPDDFAQCLHAWGRSLQTGDPYQVEFRLRNKNGVYKWHLARALPFYSDGEIIKWFGTNTDIDDQKQLQRQKDDFLGIASHELKTPVTSIKAYAQVLGAMLTKEGETKKAAMVARMDAQVNRLTNLIGDLLDVTKINSGRLQFNKTLFDFNQIIKETVEDLQHTTNKHTIIENFSETGKIYTDKDRIGQVINNLITNAIKYSPHSDKIIVSTQLKNKEVTVCVQDFGIGIPEDKAGRVFEQFYRVSGDKQHTFPGLGLGLYISSEIVKREGGRMWVNSIEGKGSTFCFALPASDKAAD